MTGWHWCPTETACLLYALALLKVWWATIPRSLRPAPKGPRP